ncbi:MAG: glycosyltransferase family 4 protein [Planctomycetota bacterium]|jgi:glycosyltransferase involved in cell wall biosynthesis
MGSETKRIRTLLIAEHCNPEWVSVALVAWSHAMALRKLTDAHIVTHLRNREAFERAGLVEGQDFTVIDSERVARPLHNLATLLRGGQGKGYTTVKAFQSFAYYYFEKLIWDRFGEQIRTGGFDLVHRLTPLSPTIPSTIAARCKEHGVPFVIGPLNGGLPWPEGFNDRRHAEREWLSYVRGAYKVLPSYESTRRDAAAIIVGSQATYEQLPSRHYDRCFYIPENAIEPERFVKRRNRRAELPLRCVFLGRLAPYKGPDMLIRGLAPFLQSGQIVLEIIGDGPMRQELESLADELDVSDAITFVGWIEHEQVQDHLCDSDLLTFPSIREFGGGVVLEAMASGVVPVIADYGGPGELVTENTGYRVPMGSEQQIIQGMHDAIEQILQDPARVDIKSEAALRRAHEQFTWDAKANMVYGIYQWVLGRREKPDAPMPIPDLDSRVE